MRSARFVAHARTLRDHARQLQHVVKLPGKDYGRVRPLRAVAQVDVLEAVQHIDDLGVRFPALLVVADNGAVRGHQLTQFAPDQEWILGAVGAHQAGIDFLLAFALGIEVAITGRSLQVLRILHSRRAGDEASIDARDQRIRVSRLISHERYNPANQENDIALLRLADDIDLSNGKSSCTVCLPTLTDSLQDGDVLTAEAKRVQSGNTIGLYLIEVKNQQEVLVALFKGTCYKTKNPLQ